MTRRSEDRTVLPAAGLGRPARLRLLLLAIAGFCGPAKAEWRTLELPAEIRTTQSLPAPPAGWQVDVRPRPCQLAGLAVRLGAAEAAEWLAPEPVEATVESAADGSTEGLEWRWSLDPTDAASAVLVLRYDCSWIELVQPWPEGLRSLRISLDPRVRIAGLPSIRAVEGWWP